MKKPLISVILPIYNVEAYIDECLNSLIKQTIGFENLEVIMVNDCSTDRTPEIINTYENKYSNFHAIHMEKNSGAPGKPRNIGINHATGEYLIFLDPDDYLPLDAYANLYEIAKSSKSDFVMGKMTSFNEEDGFEYEHITFKNYLLQKHYTNVKLKQVPFFLQVKTAVYLKLVKTNFVKKNKIKFIEGVKNGEDKYYDMQLFTKANTFSYIPKCVYMYRSRNDIKNPSLTQRDIISTVQNDINIGNKIKPLLSENEYKYFQINVFRSVLWKICDPDFNHLKPEQKNDLLILFRSVVSGYDKEVVKKYFSLEEPLLSLIDKGYIQEALDFNSMLISRRWWYQKGTELKVRYKEQGKIRGSIYWRLTKPLRSRRIFQLKRKFFRRNVKDANYNSAITR